jgi:hypothetical protein
MEFGYIYVYILIVRKSDSMSRHYVYAFVAGRFSLPQSREQP